MSLAYKIGKSREQEDKKMKVNILGRYFDAHKGIWFALVHAFGIVYLLPAHLAEN